ncbi:protein of unassigned function [Methylobacterium oryzae CBMB20]|uniref:Protein of unassigned function n=1 Tax=Methylobacterium oryzae CBMB20 TaxID=693986 RepID=A0A089NYZ5_9HYPH|nr:protein of unassigned function [Methylobacterium oryzae CBMB20]
MICGHGAPTGPDTAAWAARALSFPCAIMLPGQASPPRPGIGRGGRDRPDVSDTAGFRIRDDARGGGSLHFRESGPYAPSSRESVAKTDTRCLLARQICGDRRRPGTRTSGAVPRLCRRRLGAAQRGTESSRAGSSPGSRAIGRGLFADERGLG